MLLLLLLTVVAIQMKMNKILGEERQKKGKKEGNIFLISKVFWEEIKKNRKKFVVWKKMNFNENITMNGDFFRQF